MKKLTLILITMLFCFNSTAQIEKGTFQLGVGGLPIIYPDNSLDIGYSLRANFGYSPINNLMVGIMPFIGKVENLQGVGANVYARYYIGNRKLSLFVEASGGLGDLKYEFSSQYNGIMNSLIIGPGVQYKHKNKLAIELLLQYSRLRNISYPESTLVSHTIIPTLGIQYFFRK